MDLKWLIALGLFFLTIGLRMLSFTKRDQWPNILYMSLPSALAFSIFGVFAVLIINQQNLPLSGTRSNIASCTQQHHTNKPPSQNAPLLVDPQCNSEIINNKNDDTSKKESILQGNNLPPVLIGILAITLTFFGGIAIKVSRDAVSDIKDESSRAKKEIQDTINEFSPDKIKDLKTEINASEAKAKYFYNQVRIHMYIMTKLNELNNLIDLHDDEKFNNEKVALELWNGLIVSFDPFDIPKWLDSLTTATSCHPFCPPGMRDYLIFMATSYSESNQEEIRKGATQLLQVLPTRHI
ncbi:MAG: hypothetical protein H7839_02110 [Magnetococcus sp. YQC-5]